MFGTYHPTLEDDMDTDKRTTSTKSPLTAADLAAVLMSTAIAVIGFLPWMTVNIFVATERVSLIRFVHVALRLRGLIGSAAKPVIVLSWCLFVVWAIAVALAVASIIGTLMLRKPLLRFSFVYSLVSTALIILIALSANLIVGGMLNYGLGAPVRIVTPTIWPWLTVGFSLLGLALRRHV